ncbi:lipocalin/fatty acid-binding family protein [Spirosoma arcticum]
MKKVGSWLSKALMLGMVASSLAVGQGHPGLGGPYYEASRFETAMYPALEPSKIWLNIERTTLLGQIRVDMCDAKGQVLFSEWLSKKDAKFHQRFDLSTIGDGTYTFIITDGIQRQERTFRLSTPGFEEQLPKRLITVTDGSLPNG